MLHQLAALVVTTARATGWCVLPGRRQRGQTQRSSPDRVDREEPAQREERGRQRRSSELLLERTHHGRSGGASKRQRVMSNMQL